MNPHEWTSQEDDRPYREHAEFWTQKGDRLTVVGDYLGRLPSIELLSPGKDERILDAGCGAGFIARRMTQHGARVYGCDRNKDMLHAAVRRESQARQGIDYALADITKMPYPTESFDGIACIAVLIHNSPEQCEEFFAEAYRSLRSHGRLVISLMHPALYQEGSPNRTGDASWAQYRPLERKPMTRSQRFHEDYRNVDGIVFSSAVWYHPEEFLLEGLRAAGLRTVHTQSRYVTPEVLAACGQTGAVGYPAFYQVCAVKDSHHSRWR